MSRSNWSWPRRSKSTGFIKPVTIVLVDFDVFKDNRFEKSKTNRANFPLRVPMKNETILIETVHTNRMTNMKLQSVLPVHILQHFFLLQHKMDVSTRPLNSLPRRLPHYKPPRKPIRNSRERGFWFHVPTCKTENHLYKLQTYYWWKKSILHQLSLVVFFPIIFKVLCIPVPAGFLPSAVEP